MEDTANTLMPRPPLWRIIFDCLKNMTFIGGGIAAVVATSAAIVWSVPYAWAMWVALAKGVTLNGNPWALIVASAASPFLISLGLCVASKLGTDQYQGEPSPRDYWVVFGIFAIGVLCCLAGLTTAFSIDLYNLPLDEMSWPIRVAAVMAATVWLVDLIILLFFGMFCSENW